MTAAAQPLTNADTGSRDRAHDIAKGLGILFVALAHIFRGPEWYKIILGVTTVWLMPFFFTLSGYYYRSGSRTPGQAIKRRAVQLLKPYFMYSFGLWLISGIYNLIYQSHSLWESVKDYISFLLGRNTFAILGLEPFSPEKIEIPHYIDFPGASIPFWFVATMFFAYIIFYLVADYALSDTKRFLSVTALLTIITFALNLIVDKLGYGFPFNCQNVPMAAALMLFGAMFGQRKLLSKGTVSTKWQIINAVVALAVIIGLELIYEGVGSFASGIFSFYGAVETFPCIMIGIMSPFMAVSFSRALDKIPVLGGAIAWVGQRSIIFLFVHITVSMFVGELNGITRHNEEQPLLSLLNFAITIAVIVIYRIIWESILKKAAASKAAKAA